LTNFKHHEAELLGRHYQVELGNEKTKVFKFIMMYDALLIHPTLA